MQNYVCTVCEFTYNEETAEHDYSGELIEFFDLPEDWTCPNCGVSPDLFKEEEPKDL